MVTTISRRDLRQIRMSSLGLTSETSDSSAQQQDPRDFVGRVLAMQGQDLPGALLSIG